MRMRRHESGFTLIEVMVVLAILAVLISGVSVGINVAMKNRQKTITQNRLDQVGAWIDQAAGASNLGRAPSANTTKLVGPGMGSKAVKWGAKVGMPNETNVGNETIFAAMAIPELGGLKSPELDAGAYGNTDDDEMGEQIGTLPTRDFLEFVDGWDNPFIYFAASDYKSTKGVARYVRMDQENVKAQPAMNEATGKPLRPDSFQLFSMGPDQQPNTDDDIHYGIVN